MGWKALISIVLSLLAKLFGPASEASNEKAFQKKHDAWAKELESLEQTEETARQAFRTRMATGGDSDDLLRLHTAWQSAAAATGACRRREPRSLSPGAK